MEWPNYGHRVRAMIAALMPLLREQRPHKTAHWLASILPCSLRTARRYLEQPELIPSTRVEQLLALLKQQEAEAELRRQRRLALLEAAEHELTKLRPNPAAPGGPLFQHRRMD